jgi:hypothetical protein
LSLVLRRACAPASQHAGGGVLGARRFVHDWMRLREPV